MIISKQSPFSAEKAAEILSLGKIAILPTDTVYGFSGIVDLKGKEKKSCDSIIRKIKGRDEGKPFVELLSAPEEIYRYTDDTLPPELLKLWPGPLTLIVNLKKDSPLDTELKTVAFRCPGDEWIRHVIALSGSPIYSSSVNRSGLPVIGKISEIKREFEKEVSIIVDDDDREGALPSTIISVADGKLHLIRQGTLTVPGSVGLC